MTNKTHSLQQESTAVMNSRFMEDFAMASKHYHTVMAQNPGAHTVPEVIAFFHGWLSPKYGKFMGFDPFPGK